MRTVNQSDLELLVELVIWQRLLCRSFYEGDHFIIKNLACLDSADALAIIESEYDVMGGQMGKKKGAFTGSRFHGVTNGSDPLRVLCDRH